MKINSVSMGYVYLICYSPKDLFKIGVTRGSVEKRLKELQTGNGNELHIVHIQKTNYPFKMEAMLHRKFYPKQKLNEWFELEVKDVVDFQKHCDRCQQIIDALKDNPFF